MKDPKSAPPHDGEDLVHVDDAVIGRGLRISALLLLLLAILVAGGLWLANRKPPAPPPKITPLTAPSTPAQAPVNIPKTPFTDITAAAGISFRHHNGATGEKLLPETMGSGVAFLDYDGDGDQDLLFVNGTDWPWTDPARRAAARPTPALYANDGRGRFTDVTAGSGLDLSLYGMGAAVGDYDNDGRPDVFLTAVGGNRLLRNLGGGKFADVTQAAGVAGAPEAWSTCAAWLDYDLDGRLDLFVGNYVTWSRDIDLRIGFKIDGQTRAYGQPMTFAGTQPYLYRNTGNGTFTETAASAGLHVANPNTGVPVAKSLGVAPVDLNRDGWTDLIVANDTVQNFVFTNSGRGTFREIGALAGLAFDANGQTRGAMGIDTVHYRNDDSLGVAIGNFANEMTALYVSQRDPCFFVDEAIPEGVGPASRLLLKFGIFFFDYDLDGRPDILSCNGHLDADIVKLQASQTYAQPAQLFWNTGARQGASFTPVDAAHAGPDLFQPIVGRGSAYADIDGDGDLDVVLTQTAGPPRLLRNDQQTGHHWLRVRLAGSRANRDALGARVRLRAGGVTQTREVTGSRGYLSQSDLTLTFGLGTATRVDELEILWPGGTAQKIAEIPIDRLITVTQGP
ncbi:MAG: hypothetical protein RJA22_1478 [Verrucomicrobiota bacterium]